MSLILRNNTWHVDIMIDGQRIRQSTDTGDKKLAENILAKIRTQVVEGKYYPKPKGETKLFCEMIHKMVEEQKNTLSKRSKEVYASSLKCLLSSFADKPISKITPEAIMKYQQNRVDKGLANATIALEISLISKAFNRAIKWDWVNTNPCSKIEKLKVKNNRVRYFREGEVEMLYAVLPEWLKTIVTVARFTGLRISNILELKWNDVNLFSKTITIRKTKNGEPLGLPMTETVFKTFKALNKVRNISSPYIFMNKFGKIHDRNSVSRSFRTYCRMVGMTNFRFHDLRHDFCSKLVQRGVDLYTVAALAGHKDIKTTQRYAHLSPEKLRQDIAVLDAPMTQNSHINKSNWKEGVCN